MEKESGKAEDSKIKYPAGAMENVEYDPAVLTNNTMMMVYAGPAQMNGTLQDSRGFFGVEMLKSMQKSTMPFAQEPIKYKKCPSCGNRCDASAKFCTNCGQSLSKVTVTDETMA